MGLTRESAEKRNSNAWGKGFVVNRKIDQLQQEYENEFKTLYPNVSYDILTDNTFKAHSYDSWLVDVEAEPEYSTLLVLCPLTGRKKLKLLTSVPAYRIYGLEQGDDTGVSFIVKYIDKASVNTTTVFESLCLETGKDLPSFVVEGLSKYGKYEPTLENKFTSNDSYDSVLIKHDPSVTVSVGDDIVSENNYCLVTHVNIFTTDTEEGKKFNVIASSNETYSTFIIPVQCKEFISDRV